MASIFLDCDSTLVTIEGIDELARQADCLDEVAKITTESMAGRVEVRTAMHQRFDLVRPSVDALTKLGQLYCANTVADAATAIAQLQQEHSVHIVSGGPAISVRILGEQLGIAATQIHALEIEHNESGEYRGIDQDSLLIQDDGKAQLCQQLAGDEPAVMIGDAMTDAVVLQYGIKFIQFAGVVERAEVTALGVPQLTTNSLATLPKLVATVLR